MKSYTPAVAAFAAAFVLISTAAATRQDPVPVPGACRVEDDAFTTAGGGCQDNVTGLVWSAQVVGILSHSYAQTHCSNLSEGGMTDWRLPSLAELQTVGQHGSLDHLAFNVRRDGSFALDPMWSSTPGTKKDSRNYWWYKHLDARTGVEKPTTYLGAHCVR